jgi:hypothetical protein
VRSSSLSRKLISESKVARSGRGNPGGGIMPARNLRVTSSHARASRSTRMTSSVSSASFRAESTPATRAFSLWQPRQKRSISSLDAAAVEARGTEATWRTIGLCGAACGAAMGAAVNTPHSNPAHAKTTKTGNLVRISLHVDAPAAPGRVHVKQDRVGQESKVKFDLCLTRFCVVYRQRRVLRTIRQPWPQCALRPATSA